ncbi:MAG: hypothetical protein M5T61_16405 [Acidimicrobiia bacterium]|nr:hypothetical protein [Acidimicrobiia bacterium]
MTIGELTDPARRNPVAVSQLILDSEVNSGKSPSHRGDRALHPSKTVGGVGIERIVVHNVDRDQLVE